METFCNAKRRLEKEQPVGVARPVMACGRVVENQYYGKVFYVVISNRFGR